MIHAWLQVLVQKFSRRVGGKLNLQPWKYSWTEWVAHTQHEEHANARGLKYIM